MWLEVVLSKKYWHGIYSLMYAFIVLEDPCESSQPWPPQYWPTVRVHLDL